MENVIYCFHQKSYWRFLRMDKKLDAGSAIDTQPDEVPAYQFTSPDPYAKCASLPDARHKIRFDEEGHIIVKNL